jgi:hypothetical protein
MLIILIIAWFILQGMMLYTALIPKPNFSLIIIAITFLPIEMPILISLNKNQRQNQIPETRYIANTLLQNQVP